MPLLSGGAIPLHCFCRILRHAPTILIVHAKVALRYSVPHLRSLTETLGRLLILLIFVMLHPLIHQLSRFGSRVQLLDFLQLLL